MCSAVIPASRWRLRYERDRYIQWPRDQRSSARTAICPVGRAKQAPCPRAKGLAAGDQDLQAAVANTHGQSASRGCEGMAGTQLFRRERYDARATGALV